MFWLIDESYNSLKLSYFFLNKFGTQINTGGLQLVSFHTYLWLIKIQQFATSLSFFFSNDHVKTSMETVLKIQLQLLDFHLC